MSLLKLTPTSSNRLVVVAPFTMTGDLKGFKKNPFVGNPGPAVFNYTVKGVGRAVVEMSALVLNGVQVFELVRVTYHFL